MFKVFTATNDDSPKHFNSVDETLAYIKDKDLKTLYVAKYDGEFWYYLIDLTPAYKDTTKLKEQLEK